MTRIDECVIEISRMICTPLAKLQNDTVVCFDRQVNSHAMFDSRKYEVPDQACTILSAALHQTKYHIKTALDVLEISYSSTPEYHHYWLSQGAGYTGTIWLFESIPMMEIVENTCKGLDIISPYYSLSCTIHIIGLVDDKKQYANDWNDHSEKTICENLQKAASSWEKILHTSGGSLELTKFE